MIENPELAQSFILLNLLREERNRLLTKIKSIPLIERQISETESIMSTRQAQSEKKCIYFHSLKQQLNQSLKLATQRKRQCAAKAEQKIKQLRSSLGLIRQLKKQLMVQKKQTEKIDQENIQMTVQLDQKISNLKNAKQKLKEFLVKKQLLIGQLQIGSNRIKQLAMYNRQNQQLLQVKITSNKKLQLRAIQEQRCIEILNNRYRQLQQGIAGVKISTQYEQQQKQELEQKLKFLYKTQDNSNGQQQNQRMQCKKLAQKLDNLQDKFQYLLSQHGKMDGEIGAIRAEGDFKQRDIRLNEHKIDCVKMLINRLYNCRDRLIINRRNNHSSRLTNKSEPMVGNLSRFSNFSVDFGSFRQHILKQTQQAEQ